MRLMALFNARTEEEKKVEYNPLLLPHPPHHPNSIAGRKGCEREGKGWKGLARFGNRLPSGARLHPSQAVQVAGAGRNRQHGWRLTCARDGGGW
jgi:hypothetical protein